MPDDQKAARETGGEAPRQWHGVYLAKVVGTRFSDSWVQLQVPQLLGGAAVTNWAAPLGHDDTVGAPAPGTIVLAMFLGGDINQPLWAMTSQHLR